MPAKPVEAKESVVSPLNILALVAALAAFTLTKKFGQPLLDKAQAALPAK